ncbi:MAG: DUF169 domain-containing protein [Desulfomonilaceae bacterium]
MTNTEAAQFISDNLRLKTAPIAVRFLRAGEAFPENCRRPSAHLGKRITICQAVTMARVYSWELGLDKEDLICVPAMITFGFTRASRPMDTLAKLFCDVGFAEHADGAARETSSMYSLEKENQHGILLGPLQKAEYEPDTVCLYGNPAQIMRLIQAWTFHSGLRVDGHFGGKVECTEYLLAPFMTGMPRIAIPGMGDRIFSMTQDEEMVFALPGAALEHLVIGLRNAGRKIGARYPITFYQNFQPEFPKPYKVVADELELF